MKEIHNKKILIFGGSGSLGVHLINKFCVKNNILVYSRDEAKHWALKNKLKNQNVNFIVGDIRDKNRISQCILRYNPHIIIIASALKHVDICEMSPSESLLTNTIGPQNIADLAEEIGNLDGSDLESVLMVSTDKACAPINVYGACKNLAEKIVLEKSRHSNKVKFLAVRYGNVLESRGSILPLFHYQGMHEDFIKVTRSDMTRFVMTLPESVELINRTLINAKTGELFIPKLKSMRIIDLASIFSDIYKKPIKETGLRAGEKIHESLINETESLRQTEGKEDYIIKPVFENVIYNEEPIDYNSGLKESLITKAELFNFLDNLKMLNKNIDRFEEAESGKYPLIRKTSLKQIDKMTK